MCAVCKSLHSETCPTAEQLDAEIVGDTSPQVVRIDGVVYKVSAEDHSKLSGLLKLKETQVYPYTDNFSLRCVYQTKDNRIAIATPWPSAPPNLSEERIQEIISAHYKENPVYKSRQLESMKKLGDDIKNITAKDDVIAFVGRSLILVPVYWNFIQLERNDDIISFSGGRQYYDQNNHTWRLPYAELPCFKKYLKETKFYQLLVENSHARLVLIDYVESGLGLESFTKILFELFPELLKDREILMIGVVPEGRTIPKLNILPEHSKKISVSFSRVERSLGAVFQQWSYTLPGVRHFSRDEWCKRADQPSEAKYSGGVNVVIEQAIEHWGKSK